MRREFLRYANILKIIYSCISRQTGLFYPRGFFHIDIFLYRNIKIYQHFLPGFNPQKSPYVATDLYTTKLPPHLRLNVRNSQHLNNVSTYKRLNNISTSKRLQPTVSTHPNAAVSIRHGELSFFPVPEHIDQYLLKTGRTSCLFSPGL